VKSGRFVTSGRDDKSLVDPATHTFKPDATVNAISYSSDTSDTTSNVLILNLHELQAEGHLRTDANNDVLVITVARTTTAKAPDTAQMVTTVKGAGWAHVSSHGTVGVAIEAVKTLAQVNVGNDVIMYGYPSSLGFKAVPQIDPLRALLRKGIIAGKDIQKHTIVLDCPVYFDNSGGPVFEIDREFPATKFFLIGVVTQYVPLVTTDGLTIEMLTNSGYSIATPIDAVLQLIKE
jgi:hypothetical protein